MNSPNASTRPLTSPDASQHTETKTPTQDGGPGTGTDPATGTSLPAGDSTAGELAQTQATDSSRDGVTGWVDSLVERFTGQRRPGMRESLEQALSEEGGAAAAFSKQERAMLLRTLRFGALRVDDVMVPRADIIGIDENASLAELIALFTDAGHSRIPVYRETLDDLRGMIHLRDLMAWVADSAGLPRTETHDSAPAPDLLDGTDFPVNSGGRQPGGPKSDRSATGADVTSLFGQEPEASTGSSVGPSTDMATGTTAETSAEKARLTATPTPTPTPTEAASDAASAAVTGASRAETTAQHRATEVFELHPARDTDVDALQRGKLNLKALDLSRSVASAKLRRDLLFVPPSMPAVNLLLRMQSTRVHLAMVVDEYGGTDGLVSIEDLVEEIVGAIEDEHDELNPDELIESQGNGAFIASARLPIEDLEAKLGIELRADAEEEDIDTLGGLVFSHVGRVPVQGELIRHSSGVEFEVLEADPRRIRKVKVVRTRLAAPSIKQADQGAQAKPDEAVPALAGAVGAPADAAPSQTADDTNVAPNTAAPLPLSTTGTSAKQSRG